MIPYWTIFGFATLFSLRELSMPVILRAKAAHVAAIILLLIVLIGLRYRVGGDWGTYQNYLAQMQYRGLVDALALKDPGYQLLNWVTSGVGAGIWVVNLACAIIFSVGLCRFAQTLPSPSLAIVVAVPYFVIVVAMGYTRQAAAIGFVILAISALRSGKYVRVGAFFLLAVLFHRSAVVIIPIVALSRSRNRIAALMAFGGLAGALYIAFVSDSVDGLVAGYVNTEYSSSGAAIRVFINVIPALIFLFFGRRFRLLDHDEWLLWRNFSIAALACAVGLLFKSGSVAIDRLALYIIPLQLFVFSWLPHVIGVNRADHKPTVAAVILYSSIIQFVWLNFAGHSDYWVPYQFYPLGIHNDVRDKLYR